MSGVSSRAPVTAYVGLGANLGDPVVALNRAFTALASMSGTDGLLHSSLWGSAPVGAGGPDYVNAVARLETRLPAPDLLAALQAIEQAAGRVRPYPNAPRTLDLDLLFYGDARIASPTLTVPHPRWHERAFVLRPLAELDPRRVTAAMLAAVQDQRCDRLT